MEFTRAETWDKKYRGMDLRAVHRAGGVLTLTTTNRTLCELYAGSYPYQSAAVSVEIDSLSALDAAAGNGAQSVLVEGLDANLLPISETIVPTGTTAKTLTAAFRAVHSMTVMTAGSIGSNAGEMTIRKVGQSDELLNMPANAGRGDDAFYTVPAGKKAWITSWFVGCGLLDQVTAQLMVQASGGIIGVVDRTVATVRENRIKLMDPIPVEAGGNIEIRGIAAAAATPVQAGFSLLLETV